MSNKKKIELYLDGPTFQEIKDFKNIDGYTFNPSLYKKLKAENYIEFTKKLIEKTNNKQMITIRSPPFPRNPKGMYMFKN